MFNQYIGIIMNTLAVVNQAAATSPIKKKRIVLSDRSLAAIRSFKEYKKTYRIALE